MAVVTRLTDEEIQDIADEVLAPRLEGLGFGHAEAESGFDHDGEPAIFITAVLRARAPVIAGQRFLDAHVALNDRLRDSGDERYPYLWVSHEDDDRSTDSSHSGPA